MFGQESAYVLLLLISAAITIVLAIFGARFRSTTGANLFVILMIGVSVWSFGYGLELAVSTLGAKIFWAKIQYIGIALVPGTWLILTTRYTGGKTLVREGLVRYSLIYCLPLATFLLALSNEQHGLIWQDYELIAVGSLTVIRYTYGVWFWIYVVYAYLCIFASTILLLRRMVRAPNLYQRQILFILAGAMMPWLGNAFYLTGLNILPNLDLTPLAFTLTGLFTAWAMFRFQFLDIVPIARGTIIEGLNEAIFVLDVANRIVDANPTGQQLAGSLLRDMLGQPAEEILPQWTDFIAGESERQAELSVQTPDGGLIFDARISPLKPVNGRSAGRVLVLIDVTSRKQQEMALREAMQAAETAATAKTDFLANMSHEIRTPLNAVIGMTGLLRDTPLTSEQREFVSTIFSSSDALLSIINNILDFSKIDAGKLALAAEPFDLEDCLLASLDLVKSQALEKSLQLQYSLNATAPVVVGDALRLRQILVNLLSNAVKFTDEGMVVVTVTGTPLSPPNYELRFSVRDTGIGIPAAKLDQVFDSFSQVDASQTRQFGGTGLGLAICRRLTELMGGGIWVESEVGAGSTFSFTVTTKTTSEKPVHFLRENRPQLPGRRVLFVTSDSGDRRLLSRQARTWGMHPYVAGSPSETKYWLQNSEPFDVILIDADLVQNVAELFLHEVQAYASGTPLIWLDGEQNATLPSKAPISVTVAKPIKASLLYEALVQALTVLPRHRSQLRGATSSSARAPFDALAKEEMGQRLPLHILLVEDNLVNQRVTTRILSKLGYDPDVVNNGHEALAALQKKPYDLIYMDVQMPEMDGVETTRRILAEWPAPSRPWIVAMTAHALEGDRERYLATGMDDYVSKPVRIEDIVESIQRFSQLDAPAVIVKHPHK